MRLVILTLTLLFAVSLSDQNYTEITDLPNPWSFSRTVYFSDMTHVLFYGQSNTTSTVFKGYDWQQVIADGGIYTNFHMAPTDVQFYVTAKNEPALIYGGKEGKVRAKWFVAQGASQTDLWVIDDENQTISKSVSQVAASSDGTRWAAICRDSSRVYIGDLTKTLTLLKILDYTTNGNVLSIQWRPKTTQLLISGGDTLQTRFLQLYDLSTHAIKDLTTISGSRVLDFEFSSSGDSCFFIQQSAQLQQQTILQYDIVNDKVNDYLLVDTAKQLISVFIRDSFLAVTDGEQVHVYNTIDQQWVGSYPSVLQTNPLSPNGANLLTIMPSDPYYPQMAQPVISVYALCPQQSTYYDSDSKQCKQCTKSCVQCFFKADQCASCGSGRYVKPEDFTCGNCIAKCKVCQDDNGCQVCENGYYFDGLQCGLCSKAILGCLSCVSDRECLECDATVHRARSDNGSCVCATKYYEINDKCESCPAHCLTCTSATFCATCDPAQFRVSTPQGACICQSGYYQKADTCLTCSSALEGCETCSNSAQCLTCTSGYILNDDSHKCEVDSGSNLTTIIIIVVLVVVIVVGGYFFWRFMKKRRARKMESQLESPLDDYEKVGGQAD